ncbi:MAG: hypothetical protein AAGF26_09760, partial [Cyanobacteria bacterium P01_G01_bin.49]
QLGQVLKGTFATIKQGGFKLLFTQLKNVGGIMPVIINAFTAFLPVLSAIALPLVAIAGVLAIIGIRTHFMKRNFAEMVDVYKAQTDASLEALESVSAEIQKRIDLQQKAHAEGRVLTEEEIEDNRKLSREKENTIALIEKQIEERKALLNPKEAKRAVDQEIKSLELLRKQRIRATSDAKEQARLDQGSKKIKDEITEIEKQQADLAEQGVAKGSGVYFQLTLQKNELYEQLKLREGSVKNIAKEIELEKKKKKEISRDARKAVGEEKRRELEEDVNKLEQRKDDLKAEGEGIINEQLEVNRKGTFTENLTREFEEARKAIEKGVGNEQAYEAQAKNYTKLIDLAVQYGLVQAENAKNELRNIVTNDKLSKDTQAQAAQELTKLIEAESKRRIEILKTEEQQVKNLVLARKLTEKQGEAKLFELGQEKFEEQIDSINEQIEEMENLIGSANTADSQRVQQLKEQLKLLKLQKEEAALQYNIKKQIQEIESNLKKVENLIKAQILNLNKAEQFYKNHTQVLKQVVTEHERVEGQLERQKKLLDAQQSMYDSIKGLVKAQFDAIAQGERTERRKQRVAQVAALLRYQAMQQEFQFQLKSLSIEEAKVKAALERERTANRIAEIEAKAALEQAKAQEAQAAVDLAKAKADKEKAIAEGASESTLRARDLEIEAREQAIKATQAGTRAQIQQIDAIRQQGEEIEKNAELEQELFGIKRGQLAVTQQTQQIQGLSEVIQAIPEKGTRRSAERDLAEMMAESAVFGSTQDIQNIGKSISDGFRNGLSGGLGLPQGLGLEKKMIAPQSSLPAESYKPMQAPPGSLINMRPNLPGFGAVSQMRTTTRGGYSQDFLEEFDPGLADLRGSVSPQRYEQIRKITEKEARQQFGPALRRQISSANTPVQSPMPKSIQQVNSYLEQINKSLSNKSGSTSNYTINIKVDGGQRQVKGTSETVAAAPSLEDVLKQTRQLSFISG